MDVQIIALDIDGTLTDDQKNIYDLTLEALLLEIPKMTFLCLKRQVSESQ